jgi:hypothetical protein
MANKPGVLYYSTLGMTVLYFLAGFFFLFAPSAEEMFPGQKHYIIGVALVVYGVFRIFRLRKIRQATYDESNKD